MTERLVFWVSVLGAGASALGATLPALDETTFNAIGKAALLPLLVTVGAIAYVIAVRDEHDARLAAAEAESRTFSTGSLKLRRDLKRATAALVQATARIADLERRPVNPEERLIALRSVCDKLSNLMRDFPPGAEFRAADKVLAAVREVLERFLLREIYIRENSSFVDAYGRVLEIAAANSKGESIDPQFSRTIVDAAMRWLVSFRARTTTEMLRLD